MLQIFDAAQAKAEIEEERDDKGDDNDDAANES